MAASLGSWRQWNWAGMQSRPPLRLLGSVGFQQAAAVIPSPREFLHQRLEVIELLDWQAQQRDTRGGKEEVHKHVPLSGLGAIVAGVVQLDAEHGHPVLVSANEEIDVLLADHLKRSIDLFMLEDIGQPGFDLDAAALLGDLKEAAVEAGLRGREEGLRRVMVRAGDAGIRKRSDQIHGRD